VIPGIRKAACTAIIFLLAATLGQAQQTQTPQTGAIVGTVLDASGSTVPNASVVLQGPAPKDRRTVVTGEDGFFRFDDVIPSAPFRIQVSASGLTNWTSSDIVLQAGQSFLVTGIKLTVPPVVESVTALTQEQVAAEQVKIQEQQRVFSFVPNFYVSYAKNPAPLTSKMKFQLAFKALTDPVTMAGFGVNAAIYQGVGYPSYGQGWDAYGKRLGATFAGGYAKIMIGDAIFASVLHQDPRYFYQGTGTTKSRLMHALATPFITRGDDGRREVNYSEIFGDLASGAIANAYYPSQDRGASVVARSALIGAGGRMALGVAQEFLLHKFTHTHP
jgi:hypothetical protein